MDNKKPVNKNVIAFIYKYKLRIDTYLSEILLTVSMKAVLIIAVFIEAIFIKAFTVPAFFLKPNES